MAALGSRIMLHQEKAMNASTDMGNVSHRVPSFHGAFVVPASAHVTPHNPAFTACAGTEDAHRAALQSAKGMAMLAVRLLMDERLARDAKADFDQREE